MHIYILPGLILVSSDLVLSDWRSGRWGRRKQNLSKGRFITLTVHELRSNPTACGQNEMVYRCRTYGHGFINKLHCGNIVDLVYPSLILINIVSATRPTGN